MKPDGLWVSSRLTRWSSGECVYSWRLYGRWSPGRGEASASTKSMARLRRYIENCLEDYTLLGTLTYGEAYPCLREAKRHLRACCRWLMSQGGCTSVLWVLEYQARGAPHFHLLLASDFIPHQDLARAWHRATRRTSSIAAGTSIERIQGSRLAVGQYLSKIASEFTKKRQKNQSIDWSGRYWGVVGERGMKPVDAVEAFLPIEVAISVADQVRRESRGGSMRRGWVQWCRDTDASIME